ncbi:alpha/beta hydrolase [Actinomadura madurae]|nr:alpha/beta fold hydrolase [Actinomadura madurae]MCP9951433.1 alpha/beta hydrolase [Actinomadura madurae]MCP9968207.1 alpha/beta hydrolase [Actinomadura madurae]MCP9980664.1 alpha/beta hydrolase [Actinomadura madurae]MCQ0016863.1 alpha/beta hydrolase [Actinomadura madurae]URM96924.1 alpha/beta hydrolase [Actinomadura madurae]
MHFLLVHGAWHSGAHWAKVQQALVERGHGVYAIDLPGHGMSTRFPASYFTDGQPTLAQDLSPSRNVTLQEAADAVKAALKALRRRAHAEDRVIVVAHSMGGAIVTRALQQVPHLVDHVVYVAALVPTLLDSAGAYLSLPEAAGASGKGLYIGDPAQTGAVRINPRSTDPAYLAELRTTYYTGVAEEEFMPYAQALCPDQPLSFTATSVGATADRWGGIARTYVRCSRDKALTLAVQDRMIRDADRLTPRSRFSQVTLDTGHAPFVTHPHELADLMTRLR